LNIGEKLKTALIFLVVVLVCGLLIYFVHEGIQKQNINEQKIESSAQEIQVYTIGFENTEQQIRNEQIQSEKKCSDKESETCIREDGCTGHKDCYNGHWTQCIVEQICKPNRTVLCQFNSCSFGFRTCNACGTAWGDCISR